GTGTGAGNRIGLGRQNIYDDESIGSSKTNEETKDYHERLPEETELTDLKKEKMPQYIELQIQDQSVYWGSMNQSQGQSTIPNTIPNDGQLRDASKMISDILEKKWNHADTNRPSSFALLQKEIANQPAISA
ncbi:hypothetical protein RFI_33271, partial [Reticulomyxa filosa]